jgi:hypothetical protein
LFHDFNFVIFDLIGDSLQLLLLLLGTNLRRRRIVCIKQCQEL